MKRACCQIGEPLNHGARDLGSNTRPPSYHGARLGYKIKAEGGPASYRADCCAGAGNADLGTAFPQIVLRARASGKSLKTQIITSAKVRAGRNALWMLWTVAAPGDDPRRMSPRIPCGRGKRFGPALATPIRTSRNCPDTLAHGASAQW